MNLKDYIKLILESSNGEDIEFEISLYSNGTVSDGETGNKIKFKACKSVTTKGEKEL